MKNIEGFIFFDNSPETLHNTTPLFGKGNKLSYSPFQFKLKPFTTAEEAARSANQYYWKLEKKVISYPILSKLEIQIPENRKEEESLFQEKELVIIIPEHSKSVRILGPPVDNSLRYCNTEIFASKIQHNKLTPYHSMLGETAYQIAEQVRDEIARQEEPANIYISKFSLTRLPNSKKLIFFNQSFTSKPKPPEPHQSP